MRIWGSIKPFWWRTAALAAGAACTDTAFPPARTPGIVSAVHSPRAEERSEAVKTWRATAPADLPVSVTCALSPAGCPPGVISAGAPIPGGAVSADHRAEGPPNAVMSLSRRPGCARTRTSSAARSLVSLPMGTSWPSGTTKLTQRPRGKPARSSMVRPSAGELALIMSRCTPAGSSRSRTPSAQGSGSTTGIRTCSIRKARRPRRCTSASRTCSQPAAHLARHVLDPRADRRWAPASPRR
jgi:hypothetical protein